MSIAAPSRNGIRRKIDCLISFHLLREEAYGVAEWFRLRRPVVMRELYKRQAGWLPSGEPSKRLRRRIAIVGCVVVFSFFGCAPTKPTATSAPPPVAKAMDSLAATPAVLPPQTHAAQNPIAAANPPAPKTNTPSTVKTVDPTRAANAEPNAKSSVKAPAPVASAVPATKLSTAAIAPEKTPASALDLRSLEQRLKDTHAIGVFAKLSLKNQVDDLLDEFRDFYGGKIKTQLAELRQRYDLLLMKVLTLLQDSDAALATAILSSREAIWGILKDPKKFAEI
jgi:hypothetical protein